MIWYQTWGHAWDLIESMEGGESQGLGAWQKKEKKSSSAQYQGWYSLQMILLPYNNAKSQFGREQSPFLTKVQPTVRL